MPSKYEIVASNLRRNIIEGKYNKSKKLPTEDELIKIYKVSKNTIRNAVDLLVKNGFVYKVHGSGVFLREFGDNGFPDIESMNGLFTNFTHNKTKCKVLDLFIINADENIAKKLNCELNAEVYYVKRLRYLNNEPIQIEESYFNKEIILYLNKEICSRSIFKYIQEDLKLNIGFSNGVIISNKLNKEEAEMLNLEENEPYLGMENFIYLSNGKMFDYSIEKYNYKKIKLFSICNY